MPPCEKQLLLTYTPIDGLPLLVSSNCLPVKSPRLEPAGFAFHVAALRLLGFVEKPEEVLSSAINLDGKEKGSCPSVDYFQSKGRKKSTSGQEQQDHYALLGLGHLRYLATEDQIRKCYREAALKHHPDKQAALILAEEDEVAKEARKEEIDQHFKAIQEAYEVLIDPFKRRIFDSTDEFDDEVPADCAREDFFKVFGPVFLRNARWSVLQPIPSLGDDGTPMEDVDNFYNFWYSFKSWREFPHADEFDLEQAESREHKRWMERQNTKLREKAKKEETARIRMLADNAYKKDPRIQKRKEEEKADKARKKQAKMQAKKDKEEEAARLAEEEKLRREEEERRTAEEAAAQKKSREKEKKLLRKERSRLRLFAVELVAGKLLGISEDDIDFLCTSLDIDELKNLCASLDQKDGLEQAQILREKIATVGNRSSRGDSNENDTIKDNGTQMDLNSSSAREKKEKPWNKEEVELLRKAVQKYPKGTSQRWEVISNYIGTGRTVDEILKAVKTVLLQKPDSSKAFDSFLERRKVSNVIISSPLSTRDGVCNESTVSTTAIANGIGMGTEVQLDQQEGKNKSRQVQIENGKPVTTSTGLATGNGSVAGNEEDEWSSVQEGALVKALKAFPKETPQRWDRIAAAVPGRTKVQCYKKFVGMREKFRSKKGAE